jgi:hypothetical protein
MEVLRASKGEIFVKIDVKKRLMLHYRAWGMAESVLPSFADGFSEWLGAQVIILAVSPNPSNGEITMQSCVSFHKNK